MSQTKIVAARVAVTAAQRVWEEARHALVALETTYKQGDLISIDGDVFLVVRLSVREVGFICMADGNRWSDPYTPADPQKITTVELEEHTNYKVKKLGTVEAFKDEIRSLIEGEAA